MLFGLGLLEESVLFFELLGELFETLVIRVVFSMLFIFLLAEIMFFVRELGRVVVRVLDVFDGG